jgi:hypothetical protein
MRDPDTIDFAALKRWHDDTHFDCAAANEGMRCCVDYFLVEHAPELVPDLVEIDRFRAEMKAAGKIASHGAFEEWRRTDA